MASSSSPQPQQMAPSPVLTNYLYWKSRILSTVRAFGRTEQKPEKILSTSPTSSEVILNPPSKDSVRAVDTDLYNAWKAKKYSEVSRLCHAHSQNVLQKITIYNDTTLHMAAHSKQKDLLLELLKMLPADCNSQLSGLKNADGNTVLHEVAASDAMKDAAEELLKKDQNLITQPNELGERPIFCAARYGQIGMFKFLADKMELEKLTPEEIKARLQRNDGTTVLHISIVTECFELSKLIAERYPFLIKERDESSMTALQYLACNPTAFQKGKSQIKRGFIEYLINKSKAHIRRPRSLFLELYDEFFKYDKTMIKGERCLKELVQHLVQYDTSWITGDSEETKMETEKKEHDLQESLKSDESPLFLATMSNIEEIVEEILKFLPDALKHTNKDGMNILHVAVLYRHTDIFDMVTENFEVLARRLLLAKDNKGNSVLHMASLKRKSQASEKMQSPALQLRNELLLFEKVKKASRMLVSKPLNNNNKTAEELFAATNEQLHQDAKEWLMRTTENCTILSVFIATVAFAAAYTVPGGPDQDTGYPMFRSKPFFAVFLIADMISISSALISVGMFLSILTSSCPLEDFKTYLFTKLVRGIICLILSISTMAVAFGATIVLMMARNRESVFWDVVAFLPVPIFFLSYSPLRSVLLGPCRKWLEFLALCFLLIVVLALTYVGVALILAVIVPIALPFAIVDLILAALIFVPYGVFKGLRWAGEFIHKHVLGKSGNPSQPIPDTLSPHHPTSTTATSLHQV